MGLEAPWGGGIEGRLTASPIVGWVDYFCFVLYISAIVNWMLVFRRLNNIATFTIMKYVFEIVGCVKKQYTVCLTKHFTC